MATRQGLLVLAALAVAGCRAAIATPRERVAASVSATTIHGWQTGRLVRFAGALYASAARPNPNATDFWDHRGVFFRREADGSWREAGELPFNPYTMAVGPDGTFWAVAPSSYEDCRVYRTARPGDLGSFEEVYRGSCSYLGAGVSPEGNFLLLYAKSPESAAGKPNAVVAAFFDRETDSWHESEIPTPEGRYGYEGILLRGRSALAVLNAALTDPEHPDTKGGLYTWRHVRLARCDDLARGDWVDRGWLLPRDGKTFLQDLVLGPDGLAYLSYAHASAPSQAALHRIRRVPHFVARIRDDLTVEAFETGLDAASTRLLVDSRGRWRILGRVREKLRIWDLAPEKGFRPSNERVLGGTEALEDYVVHTLRPERFGGENGSDTIHLLGAPTPPDPPGRERGEVALWHVAFRIPQ